MNPQQRAARRRRQTALPEALHSSQAEMEAGKRKRKAEQREQQKKAREDSGIHTDIVWHAIRAPRLHSFAHLRLLGLEHLENIVDSDRAIDRLGLLQLLRLLILRLLRLLLELLLLLLLLLHMRRHRGSLDGVWRGRKLVLHGRVRLRRARLELEAPAGRLRCRARCACAAGGRAAPRIGTVLLWRKMKRRPRYKHVQK